MRLLQYVIDDEESSTTKPAAVVKETAPRRLTEYNEFIRTYLTGVKGGKMEDAAKAWREYVAKNPKRAKAMAAAAAEQVAETEAPAAPTVE